MDTLQDAIERFLKATSVSPGEKTRRIIDWKREEPEKKLPDCVKNLYSAREIISLEANKVRKISESEKFKANGPDKRAKHVQSAAKKMHFCSFFARFHTRISPDNAFALGLLHDIGYAFTSNPADHAKVGGELLKAQGFPYWKEVYYHGVPNSPYHSPELEMLNWADMTTGPDGQDMTVFERITDIASRYGTESKQTKDAIVIAKQIGAM